MLSMGIEAIREAVELTLISGQLENEQPGSILITAEVEEGKTHLVARYKNLDGVAYLADASAFGILRAYQQDLQQGRLKHLIFPELIRPLERQQETASALVAFLGELMEEGVKEIHTYATDFKLPQPVKAGVIACIARGNLKHRINYWNQTGFLSRFLVISYSYGDDTANKVMNDIILRKTDGEGMFVLPRRAKVNLPPEIGQLLTTSSVRMAKGLYAPLHGYRMQKHLQRLVMASALRAGRDTVTKEDLITILDILGYVNLDYKAV